MSQIRVRNRLKPHENVSGATVTIASASNSVSGVTNSSGSVTLNIDAFPDGDYTLTVTPSSTSTDPVGPAIAGTPTPPDSVFRSLAVTVSISAKKIT
ncbi:MAG: hypothetical protein LC126_04670, partial [Bryobacterales bacterium]|nr:hypothetical protein [Bryobacterales bacterium]